MLRPAAAYLKGLTPYDPKYLAAEVYLNANENPYGLSEKAFGELQARLPELASALGLNRYPDPLASGLRLALAKYLGLKPEQLLIGNGGDELIFDLILAWGGAGRKLLVAPPCFSSYGFSATLNSTELVEIARQDDWQPDADALLQRLAVGDIDCVMLASPNNPTGDCLAPDFVEELLQASDALVLIDQAYVEFADPLYDLQPLLKKHDNLVLLRTFSKAWGLAGMRLGYLMAADEAVIAELLKVRQPYSVDRLAPLLAELLLADASDTERRSAQLCAERERVYQRLESNKSWTRFDIWPSEANFLLLRHPEAALIWQRLYEDYGILVRDFSAQAGLAGCLRISIGTPEENDRLIAALTELLMQIDSPFEAGGASAGPCKSIEQNDSSEEVA
jgi:histidinol-phosphate aminotransferase